MEYLPPFLFACYIFFKLWVSRKAPDEGLTYFSCMHPEDASSPRIFVHGLGTELHKGVLVGVFETISTVSSNWDLYNWNLTINSGICHFESSFSLSARQIFQCQVIWKTSTMYLSRNCCFFSLWLQSLLVINNSTGDLAMLIVFLRWPSLAGLLVSTPLPEHLSSFVCFLQFPVKKSSPLTDQ